MDKEGDDVPEYDETLRIGVIGAGTRGKLYSTALTQLPKVAVVAVADVVEGAAANLAERFQARSYGSHRDLLNNERLHAVVIATPDFAHTEPVLDMARAGMTMLVEKPLTMNKPDAHLIAEVAEAAGARIVPAFENRWNPQYQVVKNEVESGAIGAIVGQTLSLNDTIEVPTRMLSWSGKSSPAWFLMPHSLDLALWISGATPIEVSAHGTRGVCDSRGVRTWDLIYAHVLLSDGGIVSLESGWILPSGMPRVFDSHHTITGASGALRVNISETGVDSYRDRYESLSIGYVERFGRVSGFPVDLVRDFVASLRGEPQDLPSLADGVIVTDTIDAIHRSLESRRTEII